MSKTNTTSSTPATSIELVDLNVRHAEKQLRVRFGHRRTLAAVAAGAASGPVVVAADEATTDAASVERLVGQYAENEHRTGLSNAERIGVIEQLSAFGVSSAQIAKRTKATRTDVDAAGATALSLCSSTGPANPAPIYPDCSTVNTRRECSTVTTCTACRIRREDTP